MGVKWTAVIFSVPGEDSEEVLTLAERQLHQLALDGGSFHLLINSSI